VIRNDSFASVAVPRRADPPAALARLYVHRLRGGSISPQAVQAIAAAITHQEGNAPNSISSQNNNPGNLVYAGQAGASPGGAGGFAKFDSLADGQAALANQITLDAVRGTDVTGRPTTTIAELVASWAPASDPRNDPAAYAASVGIQTGYDVNAPLSSLGAPDSGGTVVASSYSLPSGLDSSGVDTSASTDDDSSDSAVVDASLLGSPVNLAFAGAALLLAVVLGRLFSR
jgi:hypothetical protein